MKKACFLLSSLLFLAALVACQPAVEEPEATETPTALPGDEGEPTEAAPAPTTELSPPTPSPLPDDYPPPQAPSLPSSAYPAGGMVWILRPFGQQCAEESTHEFTELADAVEFLEGQGITVEAAETVSLMVCEACNVCPTSEHYRVQIPAEQLPIARSLGWNLE